MADAPVTSGLSATSSPLVRWMSRIFLRPHLSLERPSSRLSDLCIRVPPSVVAHHRQYRNINLSPIVYAFPPRLRIRLTLGGSTFPRKPWAFGEGDSHPFYRYSYRQHHFHTVHESFPSRFSRSGTLLYHPIPPAGRMGSAASAIRFSPADFRRATA